MGKAKFLFGRILNMNYKQFFSIINEMHERSHKSRIYLFCDCIYCGFKYQAGYMDYRNSCFYNLTKEQREDVITRGVMNQYVARFNNKEYVHLFNNKVEFNNTFSKFLKRDWLFVESKEQKDEFMKFIEDKEDFILKPIDGIGGRGIEKLPAKEESFDSSIDKVPYLAEERLIQVDEMSQLNPTSINTIRLITFVKKDGTSCLVTGFMRIGRGGLVDNFCSGGMFAPVNVENGTIEVPACDGEYNVFEKHPITNVPIKGFKIPHFDEIKEMVLEAALVVPEVRMVGWDIANSINGPCLIEGNDYPAYFYNFPEQHPDGKGLKHVFDEIMNE